MVPVLLMNVLSYYIYQTVSLKAGYLPERYVLGPDKLFPRQLMPDRFSHYYKYSFLVKLFEHGQKVYLNTDKHLVSQVVYAICQMTGWLKSRAEIS